MGTGTRGLYHDLRLGYQPRHLVCRVQYRYAANEETRELFALGPWDVVKAMKPLAEGQERTPAAIRQEEAEALARAVSDRLSADHRWAAVYRPDDPKVPR